MNPMNRAKVDDRSGLEIARTLDGLVKKKSRASVAEMLLLGVLAGIYIGFGAMGATTVTGLGGCRWWSQCSCRWKDFCLVRVTS